MEAADVVLEKWQTVYRMCTEGGREEEQPEVIHLAVVFWKITRIHSLSDDTIHVWPVLPANLQSPAPDMLIIRKKTARLGDGRNEFKGLLLNMKYLTNIHTEMLKRVLEIWVWKNSEPKAR